MSRLSAYDEDDDMSLRLGEGEQRGRPSISFNESLFIEEFDDAFHVGFGTLIQMSDDMQNFLTRSIRCDTAELHQFLDLAISIVDMESFKQFFQQSAATIVERLGFPYCTQRRTSLIVFRFMVLERMLVEHPLQVYQGRPDFRDNPTWNHRWAIFIRDRRTPIRMTFVEGIRQHAPLRSVVNTELNVSSPNSQPTWRSPSRPDTARTTGRPPMVTVQTDTQHPEPPMVTPTAEFSNEDSHGSSSTSGIHDQSPSRRSVATPASERKYSTSSFRREDTHSFMASTHHRTGVLPPRVSAKPRHITVPDTLIFNGRWDSFPNLRRRLEAAIHEANMSHLIDPHVQQEFLASGGDYDVITNDLSFGPLITPTQFRMDVNSFYGTLAKIFSKTGRSTVEEHARTRNSLAVYSKLVNRYQVGGNRELTEEKWTNEVHGKVYDCNYPGGMGGFATEMDSTFRDLHRHFPVESAYLTQKKCVNLTISRLRASGDAPDWLLDKCRKLKTMEKLIDKLTSEDQQTQTGTLRTGQRRQSDRRRLLHKAIVVDDDIEDDFPPLNANFLEAVAEHNRLVANVERYAQRNQRGFSPKEYRIPNEIFKFMTEQGREDFFNARSKALKLRADELGISPGRENSKPPNKEPGGLPRQYGARHGHLATQDDDHSEHANDDTDPSEASADADELADHLTAFGNLGRTLHRAGYMTRTVRGDDCPTVRAHTEYYSTVEHDHGTTSDTPESTNISDSGADTSILNGSYLVISRSTRVANLVGFDARLGIKKGLPIVNAVTKTKDANGDPILLGVREGVMNAGAPHTLLSEHQIRHSGLICDSVCKTHLLTPDGQRGTQRLYFDPLDYNCHIPFRCHNALMTFQSTRPTEDDIAKLKIYWITADGRWAPQDYNDSHTHAVHEALAKDAQPLPVKVVEVPRAVPQAINVPDGACPPHEPPIEIDDFAQLPEPMSAKLILKTWYDKGVPPNTDAHALLAELAGSATALPPPDDLDEDLFFECMNAPQSDVPSRPTDVFFDPYDYTIPFQGRAFNLTVDFSTWTPEPDDTEASIMVHSVIDSVDVDLFLVHLDDSELYGRNAPFDVVNFVHQAKIHAIRAKHQEMSNRDINWLSKWFNRPIPIIKETLKKTTRLRKAVMSYPLRHHFRSRFRWLSDSIFRLQEIVSTDPIFSSTPAFDGSTAAQVYYGLKSHMINMYGMRSKGEFLATYKKFVRDEGAPSALKRDNSWEQRNQEVMRFNLELHTGNMFSEPGYQHQNDVERAAIRFLKENIVTLMDRSGADLRAWLLCGYYLCEVYNCTADLTLTNNMTPREARHSQQADISHLVDFRFWEPVYYIDPVAKWPETKELKGYWAGIAPNIGDSLTYWIVPEIDGDLKPTPIARSVVRSATNRARENLRKPFDAAMHDPEIDHKLQSFFGDQPLVASKRKKNEPRRRPSAKANAPRKHKSMRNNPAPPPSVGTSGHSVTKARGATKDRGATSDEDSEMREYEQLDDLDSPTPIPPPLPDGPPSTVSTIAATPAADGPWPRPLENKPTEDLPQTPSHDVPTPTPPPAVRRSNRLRDRPPGQWQQIATGLLAFTSQVLVSTSSVVALDLTVPAIDGSPVLPLEPAYVSPTGLSRADLERHRALVTMDCLNRDVADQAAWDVLEVLDHRIATTPRRSADNTLLRSYHLRIKSKFRDGHVAWIQGEALRNDDPFPLVQYAHRNGLQKMKWFKWTQAYADDVDGLERMRQAFAAKATNAPKYKFGVQVPSSPKHALFLDKVNGDNYWETAMRKEFESLNEYNTFRVLEENDTLPSGYKRIPYHIIFDVKFDLRRKARLVANGSWTDPPKEDVYSGVVGIDTIRLGFALGSMTGLKCCAADVGTAFLNGRTTEKVFVIAGPEFGKDAGKRMVIEKGLYGLRSSSARFHEHLSTKLRALGFRPSLTDADFWFRKKDDHYEYLATYVDDILHWSKEPMLVIEELKKHYTLKGVGVPEYYLGGNVEDIQDPNYTTRGITTALSAKTYIKNVTEKLQQNCGGETFRSANTPLPPGCHPELDESPFLDAKGASQYRALIGSANWCVTLGRFDVAYATNTLARFNMAPREGHLALAKRIFGYLSNPRYIDGKLMIDPNYHTLRKELCVKASSDFNWQEFYPDAEEDVPVAGTVPSPIGKPVRVTIYVDADHAHCQVSSRSVTGILVFVNNTLVRCISKRQRTVETSTYGSELVAARIAVEMAMEYRFALRSIGAVIDGPVAMFGDNNAVVLNTTLPSSQLKKKHQAVCYHRVREAVAARIVEFKHIPSWANYADVLTKPVGTATFHSLLKPILFRSAWKDKAANWIANNLEAPGSSKEGRTAITFEK